MPGHQRTNVDVQFGNWEFGTDSSPFSFGSSETTAVDGITNTLSSRWDEREFTQNGKHKQVIV